MEVIPLEATPNQEFSVTLDDQDCWIKLVQRGRRMYLNLTKDDEVIRQGCLCLPCTKLLGDAADFSGNLYFVDTLAESPEIQEAPQYEELGTRWLLYYLDDDEVTEAEEYYEEHLAEVTEWWAEVTMTGSSGTFQIATTNDVDMLFDSSLEDDASVFRSDCELALDTEIDALFDDSINTDSLIHESVSPEDGLETADDSDIDGVFE